jgi:hypothetical protein
VPITNNAEKGTWRASLGAPSGGAKGLQMLCGPHSQPPCQVQVKPSNWFHKSSILYSPPPPQVALASPCTLSTLADRIRGALRGVPSGLIGSLQVTLRGRNSSGKRHPPLNQHGAGHNKGGAVGKRFPHGGGRGDIEAGTGLSS